MSNLFDVGGRVVVITGGLGQLGQQFAKALHEAGAKVALLDTSDDRSRLRHGLDLPIVKADVTKRATLEAALERISAELGEPYALINNAALDSPPGASAAENGPFEDYPEDSLDKVLEVNLKGVMLTCQVFGGAMARAGRGSIVNISSIYGVVSPDQRIYEYRRKGGDAFYKPIAYSASKSGVMNLTRYLATYWAPKVRVNTLTFAGVFNNQDEQFLQGYTAKVPLGRMAREDEYNGAVIFLVSDASSYMTGSNVTLDGGWTAW